MKKIAILIVLAAMTLGVKAQSPFLAPAVSEDSCDYLIQYYDAPYFFCDCKFHSHPFAFPIDTVISDTVWYTATINDIVQGVTAYWFSNCVVTMEIYPLCVSHAPAFSLSIGSNRMTEMSAQEIRTKMEQYGDVDKFSNLKPAVRIYPQNQGSGHVYCYPYDQGPHSTCDNPLPLYPAMTFVCSEPDNVYRLPWSSIAASGHAFLHWRQKNNLPAQIRLTLGSCDGEEIAHMELSDSMHVLQPNAAILAQAREQQSDIWVHVDHEEGTVGRLSLYNDPKYTDPLPLIKGSTCAGMELTAYMRTYTTDTAFNDTLWVAGDTLQAAPIRFAFSQPKTEYDTVRVTPVDIRRGYRYPVTGTLFYEYGDTLLVINKEGQCTRMIMLTILNPQGVEMVDTDKTRVYKYIQDGQLFIIIDDRKYNVFGQSIF